ncbi:terminase [Staphylococcus epidermidis]|uniref:terminase n=1 Tax=Staphylococcus epidermidis TaxID=1282 RepID=UPI0011A1B838|nr:terminase [Staphylococcus epidermidis]MBM0784465.1 terminase [Staphylococcus epidermidis]MBM0813421.1 terminase [Staphylococcus epidermidis]MCG1458868.1 terminase [Staphylococcus epidermidis]MCG1570297.1 terminase [Staphylococcus epidermidis]MCG2215045.1 terminase [Staphylococcus epidermidis]
MLIHECSPKLGLQHLSACLFEGDEEDKQRAPDKIKENSPNRTMIVDDIPLVD